MKALTAMFQNCRMNFQLAYKPRACLQTVNPRGRKEMERENGLGVQTRTEKLR
jgi:hypothetical protein